MSIPTRITREQSDDRDAELRLSTRRMIEDAAAAEQQSPPPPRRFTPNRLIRATAVTLILLILLATAAFFAFERYLRAEARASLPQLDGTLTLAALSAPVTVQRDSHGVPHIAAANLDDLVFAQAFVTTSDRLFQMDSLRRHAAGELAEILGPNLLPHDRLQRTLQIRAAADRAVAALPPDQLQLLTRYAQGVNASIAAQSPHLPIEFRVLRYTPAPWTPRDSILITLAMFQDLTNSYPTKLARESLSARLPPDLVADLYPVGSWRDHPPTTPEPDLTLPGPPIEQVPLDESQARLTLPTLPAFTTHYPLPTSHCPSCSPGSNNWVVSGAHTASGSPLLANDMHLNLSVPDIWYAADLETHGDNAIHVAGVSIPGLPLIVVGHNQHIAWGFTNLGADVQDVYIETLRNSNAEFRDPTGAWQPVTHIPELMHVHNRPDETLDVLATRHGDTLTPILTPTIPGESRTLALRWTLYDPTVLQLPQYDLATAHDWPTFLAAVEKFGGPAQNIVYADDQGHIGYHASGRIPLRGQPHTESPLASTLPNPADPTQLPDPQAGAGTSPDPTSSPATPAITHGSLSPVPLIPTSATEWAGYIPFAQLPQVFDPTGGVIATANSRVTPDDYPYPITLNWAAPYRNERIWHLLAHRQGLTASDMLAIQSDIYSDFDKVLAQRLAYAVDHITDRSPQPKTPQLLQAADLLRNFSGQMTADSAAAAIVSSVHNILWRFLLDPQLHTTLSADELNHLYAWGERDYALEQLIMHTPARWLPKTYATWDDLLAAALARALADAKAPADLAKWRYGSLHTVDLEHPIFAQSPLLTRLLALPTGTGPKPQSGDGTTVKQVGHTFGPSERFTADLAHPQNDTLTLTTGQSGNPASPFFLDQFPLWYHVATLPFPPTLQAPTHTLTLTPH